MRQVRVGILGFAHGHVEMYCDRWRRQPELGVKVTLGWDHDVERGSAACARHDLEFVLSSQDLVSRDDVDAVVIAAETSLHADLVKLAAQAGKAVVLQKPIALTLEQADCIVDAINRFKVPFTLAWQMRVDPHNLKAKSLLEGGMFGRVFMVRRRHCLATQCMKDFDKSWHVNPDLNRDIFADDASHPIDFIYWLLGKPCSVVAEMGTLLNPAVPNDNAIAIFRYPDGKFAEVSCTFTAVAGENTLEIVCEKGVIIGNYGDGPSCSVPRPAGSAQLKWYVQGTPGWTVCDLPDINSQAERIANLAAPMAEFLRGQRPAIATAEEAREVFKLVLACYESAEQGRRVHIS